jgi:hypothetical protein
MRIALISDLHATDVALRAVLDDIARVGVDQIICLGDVATLGPSPNLVLQMLRDIGCPCITGNHDAFLLDPQLIAKYQRRFPGFDGKMAAAMEVPVRRAGKADLIVVDAKGQIAIVECKRASNPESRRYVIGQVFEYAAGLWKCDYEDFKHILARRALRTKPFEDVARWDEETFRTAVSQTLKTGDFRLFIAVDEMTERLEKRLNRTVTLLNSHLPKVCFLAIAVPRDDGPVDRFGDDPEAIEGLKPRSDRDRWTPLIDEIDSSVAARVAKDLFTWADRMRSRGVTVVPAKTQGTIKVDAGPLFRVKLSGEVRVSLSGVVTKDEPWNESTTQLVQELEEIGFRLVGKGSRWRRRPEAPCELLADDCTRAKFLALMERHRETLTG